MSPEQREKELRFISHSVWQLHDAILNIADLKGPGGAAVQFERWPIGNRATIMNALLESVATHGRALASFLERHELRKCDMDVKEHAPDWRPSMDVLDKRARAFVSKYLAHLTKDRWEIVDGKVGVVDLAHFIKVLDMAEEFFKVINRPCLKPGWKTNLDRLIAASTLKK